MNHFIFLENHSVYSLCEGTMPIEELAACAKAAGFTHLSLCDTNGFYGIVDFIVACRDEGLIPVIGSRIKSPSFNGILVAKNMKGYAKICRIISRVHLEPGYDLKSDIAKGGASDYHIITADAELLNSAPPDLYAEINVLTEDYSQVYSLARKKKIKPVLIYPVYFQNEEDYNLHLVLRAIYHNKKLSALGNGDSQSRHAHFVPAGDIIKKYSFMDDALRNTAEIAESSVFDFKMGKAIFPKYADNGFVLLKKMCFENIKLRYDKPTDEIVARLNKELDIIKKKGFADYFLVVHDIVKQTVYTCGRGSAAASLVAYLLFITHVDPIAHSLFFERFINEARSDPPDIDVDFPWDTRDDILDYIFNKYSRDHAAMVSNHITFSVRSSVREIAKVYGIPEPDIKKITKNIGFFYNRNIDDLQYYLKISTNDWRKIYDEAVRITGIARHMSVHCGGVVITPKPIHYYIPVERAAKGVNIIQLEKDQAEDFGFVKIDILGNRSLAVVRDTLALVKEHRGVEIRYESFNPLNDKKTIDMLARGDTIGVFYVESPAMRQLQKKARKGDYEHLVIHSSIIRPAANRWINEYLERLRGKPYMPLLPEMGELLSETYGVMCYQEDITKIAMAVADFGIAEAEELRKVISNSKKRKRLLQLKEKLYHNLKNKNI
ncbi:MAG: PHP domain-containing protein, partial [Spirochaetes bacterium]|nr:PHP domain-containing protein [Spirochaetota bacterium]